MFHLRKEGMSSTNGLRRIASCFFVCVLAMSVMYAQGGVFSSDPAASFRSAAAGLAEQEFRRGVQAYYRGAFNDAVLQFEKALSYAPEENLILDWLGKSYYRSGIEGTALQHWQYASDAGYGGLLLENRIDVVKGRRLVSGEAAGRPVRYTESGSYVGRNEEGRLVFSQPVSVLPEADGTIWVLSYGSNELLKMDMNGFVSFRVGGALNGFDRPMDVIKLHDGHLLVSEFAGDRLSMFDSDGRFIKTFGKKGSGNGCFVGPQYLAQDGNGNIYVTDFGNSRVVVFDSDGNPLFFFGEKKDGFSGLRGPTGIAFAGNAVFVADCLTGAVYKFDTAGNYLGLLCREGTFRKPESMKVWGKFLVLCDSNKVYSIDSDSGAVFENVTSGNAPSRLTSAVPDMNGTILVTDFTANEIYVMAKMQELVGGLFVQIERVVSDSFPNVVLEVKVENRSRQSVIGLKESNFLVTENSVPVADYKLESAVYADSEADITLLIDRSVSSASYFEAMEGAVREIAAAMGGRGVLRIVSAGAVPVLEYEGSPAGISSFSAKVLRNPVSSSVALDVAVRLCSNPLINSGRKAAIVYIGDGRISQNGFSRYGLSDTAAYLNNNGIAFVSLMLRNAAPDDELSFLCGSTEGGEYYVYRDSGLAGVVRDIIAIPSGVYILSYKSSLPTNFGQRYLPVEAEAFIMNRSGRDETGYFAPLQ